MHGPHCTKKPSAFYGGANIAKKSYAQCKNPDFLTLLHSESIFFSLRRHKVRQNDYLCARFAGLKG